MGKGVKVVKDDWEKIKKELQSATVKVGYIDGGGEHEGGMSNARLASIHEFGEKSVGIPERSFIRAGFDESQDRIINLMKRYFGSIIDGKITIDTALGRVGARLSADIKKYVTIGANLAPNKPETIRRKGSDRPLIDTGRLITSLTWAVGKNSGSG